MILIGSTAAPDLFDRKSSDTDFIGTYDEMEFLIKKLRDRGTLEAAYPLSDSKYYIQHTGNHIVEYEIAWEGSSGKDLINILDDNPEFIKDTKSYYIVPDLRVLCALKMSHRFLRNSPHFEKTMNDILKIRQESGFSENGFLEYNDFLIKFPEWFKKREAETYTYEHPKLNQSKKNFFDTPGVVYTYEHDDIHQAIALYDRPAYESFKDDQAEVFCSKFKFNESSREIRLASAYEESCVLALERCLIPFDFVTHPDKAFKMALQKVCTSITSGWWREFAWENYYAVLDLYKNNSDYVTKFHKEVRLGNIRRVDL